MVWWPKNVLQKSCLSASLSNNQHSVRMVCCLIDSGLTKKPESRVTGIWRPLAFSASWLGTWTWYARFSRPESITILSEILKLENIREKKNTIRFETIYTDTLGATLFIPPSHHLQVPHRPMSLVVFPMRYVYSYRTSKVDRVRVETWVAQWRQFCSNMLINGEFCMVGDCSPQGTWIALLTFTVPNWRCDSVIWYSRSSYWPRVSRRILTSALAISIASFSIDASCLHTSIRSLRLFKVGVRHVNRPDPNPSAQSIADDARL